MLHNNKISVFELWAIYGHNNNNNNNTRKGLFLNHQLNSEKAPIHSLIFGLLTGLPEMYVGAKV